MSSWRRIYSSFTAKRLINKSAGLDSIASRRDENCLLLHLLLAIPACASASVYVFHYVCMCMYVRACAPFTCSLLRGPWRRSFTTEPGKSLSLVEVSAATKITRPFKSVFWQANNCCCCTSSTQRTFPPLLPRASSCLLCQRRRGGDLFLVRSRRPINKQEHIYIYIYTHTEYVTFKRYERKKPR